MATEDSFKSLFNHLELEEFLRIYPDRPIWAGTKLDGEGWIIIRQDGVLRVKNTGARDWGQGDFEQHGHRDFFRALSSALPQDGIYLGEGIAGRGAYDFSTMGIPFNSFQRVIANAAEESRAGKLGVMLHDVARFKGQSMGSLPLVERKAALQQATIPNERVSLERGKWCSTKEEMLVQFHQETALGYEGIVAKSNSPQLLCGWCKKKVMGRNSNGRPVDAIIIGIKRSKEFNERGLVHSVLLAVYDNNRKLVRLGTSAGLGFREKKMLTSELQVTGEDNEYVYVEPRIVVEVTHQEVSRNADGYSLRFPRISRLRPDKLPKNCSVEQIAPKAAR